MDSNVTKEELADVLRFVASLLDDGDIEDMRHLKYQMHEYGVKAGAVADMIVTALRRDYKCKRARERTAGGSRFGQP